MSVIPLVRLAAADNVMSAPYGGSLGDVSGDVVLLSDIPPCHKVACKDIASGESVIKYGCAIGVAGRAIKKGEWVHDHNIRAARRDGQPAAPEWKPYPHDTRAPTRVFAGFRRRGSRPGIRNDLWVIPIAGPADGILKHFVASYRKPYWIDAVGLLDYSSFRPSAASADSDEAVDILLGLACSPNTAGVLLVAPGLENMPVPDIRDRVLAAGGRVKCVVLRKNTEDIAAGYLDDLAAASPRLREEFPISELCAGIRGASGGYSGLSANPLLGRFAERVTSQGAAVLAPAGTYMAGIHETISERITTKTAYEKFAAVASAYSPAEPDEWENGVTTQEERALASCPITGKSPVTAFLGYGETAIRAGGVQIVPSSGELVSDCAVFAAVGAQIILLATARETPFCGVVPTVKISSAGDDASAHPEYADFSAETILTGESVDDAAKRLEDYAISVASGEKVSHERRGGRLRSLPTEP
jgi:altronate hydrolase